MERTPIKSGFLAAVGYNPETHLLEVEFNQGRVYHYFGVEPEVHKALMDAESKGRFFGYAISGKYQYKRMVELESNKPESAQRALLDDDNGAGSPA